MYFKEYFTLHCKQFFNFLELLTKILIIYALLYGHMPSFDLLDNYEI